MSHMDIVVTTGVNLEELQKELIAYGDRDLLYCKSIVLLREENFHELRSLIVEGVDPQFTTPDDLTDHQALCKDLINTCGVSKKDLDRLFKGKTELNTHEKLLLFMDFRKNKKDTNEENNDGLTEEMGGDEKTIKVESQQHEEISGDSSQAQPFKLQYSDLFGLENDETLRFKILSIRNPGESKNLIAIENDMYVKAYSSFKDKLEVDFYETLSAMYKHLCINAALSMMLHLPLNNVLDLIAESNQSIELLTKYMNVLSRQENSEITSKPSKFAALIHRVLESSKIDSKYDRIVEIIFDQTLIKASVETIKKGLETKQHVLSELISKEETITQTLDLHILPNVINVVLEIKPELIYDNKDNFMAFITVILLATITFNDEEDIKSYLLVSFYRTIRPIAGNPSKYSIETRSALLSCKLLEKVMTQTKDRLYEDLHSKVDRVNRILIEIFLLIFKIAESSECLSIYSYPPGLSELQMRKAILTERNGFDTIAYMNFISNLTEAEKSKSDLQGSFPKMYKGNYSAKLSFKGAKKMKAQVHKDTKLDENSSILLSVDPVGINTIKTISMRSIEKNDTTVNCFSNKVYVHYLMSPPKILAWGENDEYKLGINGEKGSTTDEPYYLSALAINFTQFHSRSKYSIGLTADGKIYWCGYLFDWYQNRTLDLYSYLPNEKIRNLRCSDCNIGVLTEDDKIYIQGNCRNFHITQPRLIDNSIDEFFLMQRPNQETEKVLHWEVGLNCHVYTTDNGKAYAQGNDLLDVMGLSNQNYTYVELPFQELGVTPIKPFCSIAHCFSVPLLMLVDNNGRNELWSVGRSSHGLLGQVQDVDINPTFAKLNYDSNSINFVDVSFKYCSAMALTDDGRLFGWGSNEEFQLGLSEPIDYTSPTEIPFFKDFIVHEFSVGEESSMICASPKDNTDERRIYLVGKIVGINDQSGKTQEGILHYKPFDNCNYSWME